VVGLFKVPNKPKDNYGLSPDFFAWLAAARQTHKVVVVSFGSPYALKVLQDLPTIVQAFEESKPAQQAAAQSLFGAGAISGRLPISLAANMPDGYGIYQADAKRFSFGMPEEIGLDSWRLDRLDTMVSNVLKKRIAPGCQIVVARKGKVVYNRSFGTLAYQLADTGLVHPAKDSVNDQTIYDLASVTKVAGTLQAIMFLYERGVLDVSLPLSHYLPELAGTNKAEMVIAEILSHQAGLVPFIPYWRRTIGGRIGQQGPSKTADGVPLVLQEQQPQGSLMNELFYCGQPDSNWFCQVVSPGIFTTKAIDDSIWQWTVESNLLPKNHRGDYDYKYSDLSFHIMKRLAERLLNQPIEDFLSQNLYQPLGLKTMSYRPLQKFAKEPTLLYNKINKRAN
jgi:CubicO group peptidase (beta-lactamase class C family)